jgi:YD repeat-containing protein
MSKFLLLTVCAFGLLFSSALAQAQCSYRMNDVGRSHGYLSGPCNGATQNYAGAYRSRATSSAVPQAGTAYDANGRLVGRYDFKSNSYSSPDGRLLHHNVRRGNTVHTYDANGRLAATAIRRGNTGYIYDRNGRITSRAVYNSDNSAFRLYDRHGRYVSSGSR